MSEENEHYFEALDNDEGRPIDGEDDEEFFDEDFYDEGDV